jgi:membrane associated rhomboid family serine protease
MKISATTFLILLCIATFLFEASLPPSKLPWLFYTYGTSLSNLLEGNYVCLLSSIFLHASLEHLLLNMIALYFFGKAVESEVGGARMIAIFLISSLAGLALTALFSLLGVVPQDVPTVGASGGIFGLMACAMFLRPFEIAIYPFIFPLPLFLVAVFYAIINVVDFMYVIASGKMSEIAYTAHIGGFFAGALIGFSISSLPLHKKLLLILLGIILAPLTVSLAMKVTTFVFNAVFRII